MLPLALLCGVLALWLGWAGVQQHVDASRRADLARERDAAVASAHDALGVEHKRLRDRLDAPAMQAALTAGDLKTAGAELSKDWPGASAGTVLPADLSLDYENLPKSGYGRLGAMEAAIVADKPMAAIVRDGGKPVLALAAPARVGEQLVGVAYVQLPLQRISDGIDKADVGGSSYMALRQGGYNVVERGDAALSNGAEAMAAKIPGSDLRVAAAVPDIAGGPLGLGALPCFIAAVILALLAFVLMRVRQRLGYQAPVVEEGPVQTLAETMIASPFDINAGNVTDNSLSAAPRAVSIDGGIFRAYDIRGVIGQSLDPGVAEMIGHAIGSVMHDQGLTEIVVGRDGRLSGPAMIEGLIAGLRKAGRNVIDIGMAPTPVIYFGAYHLRAGSCVSVTGSHNPPDYNGFKVVVGGETLSGAAITDLYQRIVGNRLHTAAEPGTLTPRDISEDYVQRIASDIQIDRPLKVVVDAGNGVAGDIGPRVLAAIGAEVTPLYCEIDGEFPNHHPDPSEPHNLADLIKMVARLDADLGIAFDGDGDRLGVVTRDGQNIFPDRLLMLFAADVLERNPGAMIIYDVKCTGRLPGHILRHGGSPLMWKTGHSLIKAKMRETDAELAGEMSGHFFFKERWYGFDDGIYSAARLLEILAAQPQTPSETLNGLPNGISTPEIKVDAPDGDPHTFVERFRNEASFEGARLSTIDGLRVDYPDGWGLVRASNTTPILVMRFDADSHEAMDRIQTAFRTQLHAIKADLKLPF
ncbi:phosphomannomutase/phosphoglucomutase [Lysobacter sp. ISL-42]|nr:phosphomannomutase/phosphoglucomutase [Lysobacter sp. ISL-42]MBT2749790.1 phosphomannomutase/phosphoglucomutase [Lysobacter sp. ISL-50]MBT2777491.1 phosphomannomutase/phosphoglucomutase [Lysobacter sp. ISL-54]MBT2781979.1 phosphomannomutase/phosphoglucomutase [Lysobacter sp. ISL-52]